MDMLEGEGTTPGGISFKITTFKAGSHYRIAFRAAGWECSSILQVRVTGKGEDRASLTFHQENLPAEPLREEMKSRWKEAASEIARELDGKG